VPAAGAGAGGGAGAGQALTPPPPPPPPPPPTPTPTPNPNPNPNSSPARNSSPALHLSANPNLAQRGAPDISGHYFSVFNESLAVCSTNGSLVAAYSGLGNASGLAFGAWDEGAARRALVVALTPATTPTPALAIRPILNIALAPTLPSP
jgi:hypothetical protein